MNGHSNVSALSAGLARQNEQLPALEDFSFSAILRAVDPEIRDAIDAIAEICAKSRLSLADEYDAHLLRKVKSQALDLAGQPAQVLLLEEGACLESVKGGRLQTTR